MDAPDPAGCIGIGPHGSAATDGSLGINPQVPPFRPRARTLVLPPLCRSPSDQSAGSRQTLSQDTLSILVLATSNLFRHVNSGLRSFSARAHT